MDNEKKELLITKVEKYGSDSNEYNKDIAMGCVGMGVAALYIANLFLGLGIGSPDFISHIATAVASTFSLSLIIRRILAKVGNKARIEEIKDFLAMHGLILEDELLKGRSM